MNASMRVRTGIARTADGWRVVQEITHPDSTVEHVVYDPLFATEAEAEAGAKAAADLLRVTARQAGAVTISNELE